MHVLGYTGPKRKPVIYQIIRPNLVGGTP